jgi:hypothetical protein
MKTITRKTRMIESAFIAILAFKSGVSQAKTVDDIQKSMTHLLAHEPKVTSVQAAHDLGLDQAKTREQPWTGGYWPDITGSIANHYRDRTKLGNEVTFLLRYDLAKSRFKNDHKNVREKYLSWDTEKLSQKLAPSEKYDLLIGNRDFEFTQAVLGELEFRHDHGVSKLADGNYAWTKKHGGFAYWSGICDGWAPASIYLPRPTHPVTLTGASGIPVTFYPDDIKALGTYLFARTNTPYFATMSYRFAGSACKQKGEPDRDVTGKVTDSNCNDLDAGVWHLALLNRIGLDRTGFGMDVDNNHKINNHPVFAYSMSYFNPKTGKKGTLEESTVARAELNDLYANRRDPRAVRIVGVKSTIKFSYYVWPEQNRKKTHDSPADDKTRTGEYVYDLELDADGNILGGEWGNRSKETGHVADNDDYSADSETRDSGILYSKQPDFVWMAPLQERPYSQMALSTVKGRFKDDGSFEWAWNGRNEIPEDWLLAAREDQKWEQPVLGDGYSKLKSAQALSNLVYVLFELSK